VSLQAKGEAPWLTLLMQLPVVEANPEAQKERSPGK
jgi:hypothetical protein